MTLNIFFFHSYLVYRSFLYTYSTIMGTVESLLLLALGDLQYEVNNTSLKYHINPQDSY